MRDREGRPDEQGKFRAVHAIRDALPTRRHAEMLFDMVVESLGESAWVETANDAAIRTLFRRESAGSPFLIPWPILTVARGGREGPSPLPTGIPGVYEAPPKRPGPAPRLRGLGPGHLDVHDGPHRVTVSYGGDGRWFECSRSASPDALSRVIPALEDKSAAAIELVADFVARLDANRHGPGRAYLPVPLPGGVRGSFRCGLRAIREKLFRDADSRATDYLVADGWTGRTLTWGATREAAIEAWRKDIAEMRPFPEKPDPPRDPLPEPSMEQEESEEGFRFRATLRGPSSDVPWIEPTPENSPAAVVPLKEAPEREPPVGAWTWLVGDYGTVFPAALRWEPEGFTLIGDRALDHLDPERLEEQLATADRKAMETPPWSVESAGEAPVADSRIRTYRLCEEGTGAPIDPSVTSTRWGRGFHAGDLEGDRLRWSVVRLRAEIG